VPLGARARGRSARQTNRHGESADREIHPYPVSHRRRTCRGQQLQCVAYAGALGRPGTGRVLFPWGRRGDENLKGWVRDATLDVHRPGGAMPPPSSRCAPTGPPSAKSFPQMGERQGGHVGVSPLQREALLERRCGTRQTRPCLAHTARSASRTQMRNRADTCVSRPYSAKRYLHAGAGQGGPVRVSPMQREALPARGCGTGWTRACLAHTARSALRTQVRGRVDTCVSRTYSAKRSPHAGAGRGGHVRVSPIQLDSLPARRWGRADTCVSRPFSAKRSPHAGAGQGGHVRVSHP
jgi:hypothetical protein